jgi:hypothetical protein
VQVEPPVMTTPGSADLLRFFEDDEVDACFSQTGRYRKTGRARANDSNSRLLHLISSHWV